MYVPHFCPSSLRLKSTQLFKNEIDVHNNTCCASREKFQLFFEMRISFAFLSDLATLPIFLGVPVSGHAHLTSPKTHACYDNFLQQRAAKHDPSLLSPRISIFCFSSHCQTAAQSKEFARARVDVFTWYVLYVYPTIRNYHSPRRCLGGTKTKACVPTVCVHTQITSKQAQVSSKHVTAHSMRPSIMPFPTTNAFGGISLFVADGRQD